MTKKIIADPVAFPSGIPALVQYVHSKGLKLGLYSDAVMSYSIDRDTKPVKVDLDRWVMKRSTPKPTRNGISTT